MFWNDTIGYFSTISFFPVYIPFLFLLSCHYCTVGWCIGTFTKVLTIYHILIHPLHHSPLSPSCYSWDSFNRSRFSIFIHEYIIFLLHSSSYILSLYPTPSHWYLLLERTYYTFLFSIFEKRYFCLLKIAIQGVSLWHFHVCMYYNPYWFIISVFLFYDFSLLKAL
jgi:hypothetical protein